MLTLAALVLGSTLTASGAADAASAEPPPLTPLQERRERRRLRMNKIHAIAGIGMEVGAGALHALTGLTFIGHAVSCSDTASECSKGTPVVLFLPVGAVALGWAGATRLAAAREASIWRSPTFWVGTAVPIATLVTLTLVGPDQSTRDGRIAASTAFVAGLVLGNVIQVWGAFTAPPRDAAARTRSLSLAPGCGPTAGGVLCGAFARF